MTERSKLPQPLLRDLHEQEERARDLGLVSAQTPMANDDDWNYYIIPTPRIIEQTERGSETYDLYSRLLKDRIIFLGRDIDDRVANLITAQLLFLETQDPDKEISFYINSPGGVISAGMGIYDTMQLVKCDVSTMCIGQAASMGSLLLLAGAHGKRASLPHSRIMIHQPLGGAQGQVSDLIIQYDEMMRVRNMVYDVIVKHTSHSFDEVVEACDRDHFMSPQEAKDWGIIDKIIDTVSDKKNEKKK